MIGRAVAAAFFVAPTLFLLSSGATAGDITFPKEMLGIPVGSSVVERVVEIADTSERRARGYMDRTDIAPEDGMLFVFDPPRTVSMWMMNTPTALDMIFVEVDGTIQSIAENTVPFSTDIVSSEGEVGFVLEVLAGQAEALGLEPGDQLIGPRFR